MLDTIQIVILLLLAAMTLGVFARRIGIPYPIALTLGGLALGFIPGLPAVRLDPQIVFGVFLPPILYHSALFERWHDFRANLRSISMLAVGLVTFTTVVVACVTKALVPDLPWAAAFLLGAIVSPPDAVATTAILNRLRLPARLIAVIEGESLVNDATAIILYKFALAAVLTGAFSFTDAVGQFVIVAAGGIAIGLAFGWASVRILANCSRTHCPRRCLSLAVPFVTLRGGRRHRRIRRSRRRRRGPVALRRGPVGPFRRDAATHLHDVGRHRLLPEQPDLHADRPAAAADRYAAASHGLLSWPLLVRLCRRHQPRPRSWRACCGSSLRRTLPRASSVRGCARAILVARRGETWPWFPMSACAESMSLAVAMALPLAGPDGSPLPERALILFLTFAVIVTTLVVQGLSLPLVLRLLGFDGRTEPDGTAEERLACA